MDSIRNIRMYLAKASVALALLFLSACDSKEYAPGEDGATMAVPMQIDVPALRTIVNGGQSSVNRILLLPFRKTSEALPNDNSNFVPVYSYALQKDIDQFPTPSMTMYLASGSTYKVVVIGYNRTDYDFHNFTSPANRFDFGAATTPLTLANFCLIPKSAASVPEFFSCIADVYNGNTSLNTTVFKPEQKYSLQGTLKRMVSGLSVTITGVPAFVRSISLRAENLVKSTQVTDNSAATRQTTGDGGNRILDKKQPVSGTVTFSNKYLLPTFDAYKTRLFLDVEYGSTSESHQIVSSTGDVSGAVSGNQFIFNPNEALNLTGDYSTINLGFRICFGINLDDDAWDGYN